MPCTLALTSRERRPAVPLESGGATACPNVLTAQASGQPCKPGTQRAWMRLAG